MSGVALTVVESVAGQPAALASPAAPARGARGVLTLTCPERPGIVQAVTSFLLRHELDIVEHQQFDDGASGVLFLRSALATTSVFDAELLTAEFAPVAEEYSMSYSFDDQTKPRLLVMVSKLR